MNEKSITKSDLAWLTIRVLGLIVVTLGIISGVGLITQIAVASQMPMRNPAEGIVAISFLVTMVKFCAGFYLLRSGEGVHKLLMFGEKDSH